MAASSSGSPDEILQASSGKTNFMRLARLLICGGTRIIRELFDSIYAPANLPAVLKTPAIKQHLKDLRKKKVLTLTQWQVLYPSSSLCGKSKSFDITLLFKLLRELVILIPPVKGWDELPDDKDLSLPADLARIKFYRNTVYAHGDERMELTDDTFNDYWIRIEDALMRIVKHSSCNNYTVIKNWEIAILRLRNDSLTDEDQTNVEELKSWYDQDAEVKQMVYRSITLAEETRNDVKEMRVKIMDKDTTSPEFKLLCKMKTATLGAWIAGSAYIIVRYKDDPQELVNMITKVAVPMGIVVGYIIKGSIIIGLRAKNKDALDELLRRYKTGRLTKDLEDVFVTNDIKELANGETITFSVEINEREYRKAYSEIISVLQRKGKNPVLQIMNEKQNLCQLLNKWMERRGEVISKLFDLVNKLNKLEARVIIAKATKYFESFFWPVLVIGVAIVVAYVGAKVGYNEAVGLTAVLVAFGVVVGVTCGATAFKAGVRSVFQKLLYHLETMTLSQHGISGKNCASFLPRWNLGVGLDYVPRQVVEEELQASQTTRTSSEDIRRQIMDIVISDDTQDFIHQEENVLAEIYFRLGRLKDRVKCLKEVKGKSFSSEYMPIELSSDYDKPFQIEEVIKSFSTLPQPNLRVYVESLIDVHHDDISEIVEKIQNMKRNLPWIIRGKEVNDLVETYLDELFMTPTWASPHDKQLSASNTHPS